MYISWDKLALNQLIMYMKKLLDSDWEKPTLNQLIIYMKKLFDSDWLRAVQFKCNTNANYTS